MEWTPARIRLFREAGLCLSQHDFAKALGFDKRTIGNAERATHPPSLALRRALDQTLARATDAQRDRFLAVIAGQSPGIDPGSAAAQRTGLPAQGAMLPLVVNGHLMLFPFDAETLTSVLPGSRKVFGVASTAQLADSVNAELVERITSAARKCSRVHMVTVEHLELVTQAHRNLYHELGSAELIAAVTGHLEVVTQLLAGDQPSPLRRRLAGIAAETAGHVAWLCHDLDNRQGAEHYYGVAAFAIDQAGDPALDAYIRGFRSLVAGSQGQPREALELAQSAVEIAQHSATATTRAWLAGLQAQALACLGDRRACYDALGRADTTLGQARREEDPAWMYEFDNARLLALSGACHGQLGRITVAERTLREAIDALGPRRTRRRADVLLNLAKVRARQLDAEEAAGLAREALEIAVETGSLTGIGRVRFFRPELDHGNGTPAVKALDELLADAR